MYSAKEVFAIKDEFIPRVGIWGQRHYNYLKKSNPTVVNVMRNHLYYLISTADILTFTS